MSGIRSSYKLVALAVGIGLALELLALAVSLVRQPGAGSWAGWQGRRADVLRRLDGLGDASAGDPLTGEVIHPYLGFVGDPSAAPGINEYGFDGAVEPIQRRSEGRLIVALVGGATAVRLGTEGRHLLEHELRAAHPDRRPVVINLARGHYKQPQQLMTLSYLLALGAEFDVVVNIDGYNELALHAEGNGTQRIHPIYPANWYLRASSVPDPRLRRLIGHKAYLELRMENLARAHSGWPWRWSMAANVLWNERHGRLRVLHQELVYKIRRFSTRSSEQHPYWVRGPVDRLSQPERLTEFLAAVWSRGSLQLMRLCRQNEIRYLHFLQPERADGPPGYAVLRRLGDSLRESGVEFQELADEHLAAVAVAVGQAAGRPTEPSHIRRISGTWKDVDRNLAARP